MSVGQGNISFTNKNTGSGSGGFIQNAIAFVEIGGNDATGEIGNPNKPFATIEAALLAGAALPYITVKIGIGTFVSPPQSALRSDMALIGSGLPKYNTEPVILGFDDITQANPTQLIGGTILQGTLWLVQFEHLYLDNFGVDVGQVWTTTVNGGVSVDAILIAQNFTAGGPDGYHPPQADYPPTVNTVVRNLVILGNYGGSAHGLLLENKCSTIVENITSACFLYCVVFKTSNCVANNIVALAPALCGVYFKSSYYSFFTGGNFTNILVDGLNTGTAGDGIYIGGETFVDTIQNITLTNFKVTRCVNGMRFLNGVGSTVLELSIFSDGILNKNRGDGLVTDPSIDVNNCLFRGIISSNNDGNGFVITTGDNNSLNSLKAISNGLLGFDLAGLNRLDVCDIFSNANVGGSINYGTNVFVMGVTSLSGAITGTATAR